MITFEKITDVHVEILLNGSKIGLIEKHTNIYTVELNYVRKRFRAKHKNLITGYVKKLHYRMNKINNPPKLPVSRLVTGNYTILD